MEDIRVLALLVFGIGGLVLLVFLLRPLDRILTEVTRLVYSQVDSSVAFLLKVIISIIFPPIFFYLIWVALKDSFRSPMSNLIADEQAVLMLEEAKSDVRKVENASLWSG
jgi:hypothetical protein